MGSILKGCVNDQGIIDGPEEEILGILNSLVVLKETVLKLYDPDRVDYLDRVLDRFVPKEEDVHESHTLIL